MAPKLEWLQSRLDLDASAELRKMVLTQEGSSIVLQHREQFGAKAVLLEEELGLSVSEVRASIVSSSGSSELEPKKTVPGHVSKYAALPGSDPVVVLNRAT